MFNGSYGGYSLADIAAATGGNGNGNGNWGDGGAWWIIILFLFCFAGWGNGNGGGFWGGNGGSTTREEISYGFDMNGLESGIRGIQQGLCDGFYAQNSSLLNGFNSLQNAINASDAALQATLCQGFNGVNTAMLQGFNGVQAQMANDALVAQQCCCETQNLINSNFANLNYNLATQGCDTRRAIADSSRDIIDSQNAGTRQILDFLTQDKIATLTSENQALKFAASQASQNAYLVNELGPKCPIPAYPVPSPYTAYALPIATTTYGFGCGCATTC